VFRVALFPEGIYQRDREYAREAGDACLAVVEAVTKPEAEAEARRRGISGSTGLWAYQLPRGIVPHRQSSTDSKRSQNVSEASVGKPFVCVHLSGVVVGCNAISACVLSVIVGKHFPSLDTGLRDSAGFCLLIHEIREPAALPWPAPPVNADRCPTVPLPVNAG